MVLIYLFNFKKDSINFQWRCTSSIPSSSIITIKLSKNKLILGFSWHNIPITWIFSFLFWCKQSDSYLFDGDRIFILVYVRNIHLDICNNEIWHFILQSWVMVTKYGGILCMRRPHAVRKEDLHIVSEILHASNT